MSSRMPSLKIRPRYLRCPPSHSLSFRSKTSKRPRHRSGLQPNTSNANLPASSSSDDAAGKTNLTDNSLNQESAAETSSAESAGLGSAAVATELRCSSVANSVSSTPDGGKEEGGKTLDQMSGIDGRESRFVEYIELRLAYLKQHRKDIGAYVR